MLRCSALAFAIVVTGSVAMAQPAREATVAYEEGRRHYDLREWDEAIAKFKEAYRLRPDASSLFNIAQSYRLQGNCTEALAFYRTYRRNFPHEKNLANVDAFIKELEPCADQAAKDQAAKDQAAKDQAAKDQAAKDQAAKDQAAKHPAQVIPRQQAVASDPGSTMRLAGISIAGAGAVVAVVGTYLGLEARSDADKISSGFGTWTSTLAQAQAAGVRDDHDAKIMWIGGGAAIAIGTALYVVGRSRHHEAPAVTVVPSAGGVRMVWTCGF